jgi:hypothetical protein
MNITINLQAGPLKAGKCYQLNANFSKKEDGTVVLVNTECLSVITRQSCAVMNQVITYLLTLFYECN